jgi:predicted Zn-dependent protease
MYRPLAVTVAVVATTLATACNSRPHAAATVASSTPVPPQTTPTVVDAPKPTPQPVPFTTAESTFKSKDYKTAADQFDAYTTTHVNNPWGFYMLGLSAWKSSDLPRAQQAFETALSLNPRHQKSLVNLSRVLLAENHADSALARGRDAVAVDSQSPDAWRVVGRAASMLGQVDSALDAFRTAIALDPTDRWSMNDMGLLLIQAGRYPEAIGPLAMAVQLDSTSPVFANNLGIALERSGHLTSAATAYEQAIKNDSTYTKAQTSFDRVKGAAVAADAEPVDLSAFRDAFVHEIDDWKESHVVVAAPGE